MPSPPDLPGWAELTAGLHVVRVPLTMPFRGVTEREAALLRGPAGWGEFAPFVEYGDAESARWLAAAVEAAWTGWPAPRRDAVPVNATVPAVGPGGAGRAGPLPRLHDREGEGGAGRSGPRRRRGQGRRGPGRARVRAGAIRVDANGGLDGPGGGRRADRAGLVRAGVRRAAVRDRAGAGRAAPAAGRRHPGRRGRERPQGRRPGAGRAGRGGRPGRAQGRADGRGAGRRCGSRPPAACRWSSPARWTRRSGSPPAPRWPRRFRTCRTPAGSARSG